MGDDNIVCRIREKASLTVSVQYLVPQCVHCTVTGSAHIMLVSKLTCHLSGETVNCAYPLACF